MSAPDTPPCPPTAPPLPAGWRRAFLGDIADLRTGGTPPRGNPACWGGPIPWVKTGSIRFRRIRQGDEWLTEEGLKHSGGKIVPRGAILIAMYGQGRTRGQVAVLDIDAAINQNGAAILVRDGVDRDFVYHQLAHLYAGIRRLGNGGTHDNLNVGKVRRIPLVLPPLAEQRRIGQILETWDAAIEGVENLAAAQAARHEGLTRHLLGGRRRFDGFASAGWIPRRLGEFLRPVTRRVSKPEGRFLSAGVRSHGRGVFLKQDFAASEIALDQMHELRAGELVVNVVFAWEGALAIVPSEADGALVSHRFPSYTFDTRVCGPDFFRHLMRTRGFLHWLGLASPGGAGRNRVLSRTAFLDIVVTLPPPSEQARIASVLSASEEEGLRLERRLQGLQSQKRGLMERLLDGRMRAVAAGGPA